MVLDKDSFSKGKVLKYLRNLHDLPCMFYLKTLYDTGLKFYWVSMHSS